MKIGACLPALLFAATAAVAETVNFDANKAGESPEGWTAGVTGKGTPKFAVVSDESAPSKPNVLKQSGEGTYLWCVKKDVAIADGFVEAKFKAVSGETDRAAGLVWRWKDGENYYVARANALENNVTIYHVIKGKRTAFKNVDAVVTANEWHTLRVEFAGTKFSVSLDGKKLIEAENDLIAGAGAAGLWTKADSVTLFDDFRYEGK